MLKILKMAKEQVFFQIQLQGQQPVIPLQTANKMATKLKKCR